MPTHYEVLGISPKADEATVRRAYRRLARKHHPDVNPDPASHDLMAAINMAFETLSDHARRSEYDAMLAGGPDPFEVRAARKPVQVKFFKRFKGHETPVYALAFADKGDALISGSFDNDLLWWDTKTWKIRRKVELEGGVVSAIQPLPNGDVVAAGSSEHQVSMWNVTKAAIEGRRIQRDDWVSCVALSPNGAAMAGGSAAHKLLVATRTGQTVRAGHDGAVTAVAWSSDGKLIATGSADSSVRLWRTDTFKTVQRLDAIRSTVTAVAFSPDGKFLAVAAVDLSIRVFTLSDGQLSKMMFGHTRPIEALSFHPNSWLFASGGREGAVKLWNADKGMGQLHITASPLAIRSLAFNPAGTLLAAGGLDKQIRLWEVETQRS